MTESKELKDDGLKTPPVKIWAKEKYRLIRYYSDMFATAMRHRYRLVYINLFAGAGRVKIEGTNEIVKASPILAIDIKYQFDQYVYCEIDHESASTLKTRIEKAYPDVDATVIEGDANESSGKILHLIAKKGRIQDVLAFCVIDPCKLADLDFTTIRSLAETLRIDFLVLVPSFMDANRNLKYYVKPENNTVERFLGHPAWREDWEICPRDSYSFGKFITASFLNQVGRLKFINHGLEKAKLVRDPKDYKPLYHLVYFSKSSLGMKFWKETKKGSREQQELFDLDTHDSA